MANMIWIKLENKTNEPEEQQDLEGQRFPGEDRTGSNQTESKAQHGTILGIYWYE